MAESHKFNGSLDDAKAVFPELPWKASAAGQTWVYDEKQEKYVDLNEGDYIVKIADRYEVSDKKPSGAKKATVKETDEDTEEQTEATHVPKAKPAEPQPDPEEGEAEVASTPQGATSFEP